MTYGTCTLFLWLFLRPVKSNVVCAYGILLSAIFCMRLCSYYDSDTNDLILCFIEYAIRNVLRILLLTMLQNLLLWYVWFPPRAPLPQNCPLQFRLGQAPPETPLAKLTPLPAPWRLAHPTSNCSPSPWKNTFHILAMLYITVCIFNGTIIGEVGAQF